MATVRENLIAAKALIDTPEKWHKGSMRFRGCLCAMAAVGDAIKAAGWTDWIRPSPEYKALQAALPRGWGDVPTFNDHPDTTHADIMALFQRAIDAQDDAP